MVILHIENIALMNDFYKLLLHKKKKKNTYLTYYPCEFSTVFVESFRFLPILSRCIRLLIMFLHTVVVKYSVIMKNILYLDTAYVFLHTILVLHTMHDECTDITVDFYNLV